MADFKLLSFVAVTATTIVLLGAHGYGFPGAEHAFRKKEKREDWQLLASTLNTFKERAATDNDILCQQCQNALEIFMQVRSPSEVQKIQNVVIPYFGTITVGRKVCDIEQEFPRKPDDPTCDGVEQNPASIPQGTAAPTSSASVMPLDPGLVSSGPTQPFAFNDNLGVSAFGNTFSSGNNVGSYDIGFDLWNTTSMDIDQDLNWLLGESQPQVFDMGSLG